VARSKSHVSILTSLPYVRGAGSSDTEKRGNYLVGLVINVLAFTVLGFAAYDIAKHIV